MKVCVTGANGFLARYVINILLQKGYEVHATLRSLDNIKYTHPKLIYFKADLLDYGSFNEAMNGCDYIIHIASPVILNNLINEDNYIERTAVRGIANIICNAKKYNSIKRIIMTSSTVAICNGTKIEYNEDDWNHNPKDSYRRSKVMAERTAWKLIKLDCHFDLITLCPGMIIGPVQEKIIPESMQYIINLLKGNYYPFSRYRENNIVDVRDVADIHVKALDLSIPSGRYIITSETLSLYQLSNIITKLYNRIFKLPLFIYHTWNTWKLPRLMVSTSKLKNIFNYNPIKLETTLKDTIDSFYKYDIL